MFANWPGAYSGLLGCPVSGMELKLVPNGDKREVRYRGPNVTPGYWRQPEATSAAFDEEGFFKTGDAVKFVDEAESDKGLLFDGRIAEDFKLNTGTWVSVGMLRAAVIKAGAPLVQDAVIAGHDRAYLAALLFLNVEACRAFVGLPASASAHEVLSSGVLRNKVQTVLDELASTATGSANFIARAVVAHEPPSIDVGEITDKGSLNQRIILRHRAAVVEALYAEPPAAEVFIIQTGKM
jgi:feruloyl-CoA synthase